MQYTFNKEKNIFIIKEGWFDSVKSAVGNAVGNVASTAMNKISSVSAENNLKRFLEIVSKSNYNENFKQTSNEIVNSAKQDSGRDNLIANCKKFIELLVSVSTGEKQRFLSKIFQKMNTDLPDKFEGLYLDGLDSFSAFLLDFINENKLNTMLKFFDIEIVESSQDKNVLVKAEKENLIAILEASIKQSNSLKYLNNPDLTEKIKKRFTDNLNLLNIDSQKDESIVSVLERLSADASKTKVKFNTTNYKNEFLCKFLLDKQLLLTYINQITEEIEQKQTTVFPNTLRKCQEIKTSGVLTSTEEMNETFKQLKQKFESTAPSDLTERKLIKEYKEEINNLLLPTMQKQLKFDTLPTINFIEDEENAKDMFGRTAHYNPNTSEITVFITGRHPKDIMRSIAHEVIHHSQNSRGEFDNAFNLGEEGYAQSNNHLRNMEKQAYLLGNMLFRDWEDNLKKQRNSNTMINEKVLRAKIRALIAEEIETQNASDAVNEPPHKKDCDCVSCKEENKILKNKGLAESTKKVLDAEKQVIPLNEWRRMELNSLLMSRFGIVAPHAILGEKKSEGGEPKTEKQKELASKTPPKDKITRGDVITAAKEGDKKEKPKSKKGKVPPQLQKYVKGKKDESK